MAQSSWYSWSFGGQSTVPPLRSSLLGIKLNLQNNPLKYWIRLGLTIGQYVFRQGLFQDRNVMSKTSEILTNVLNFILGALGRPREHPGTTKHVFGGSWGLQGPFWRNSMMKWLFKKYQNYGKHNFVSVSRTRRYLCGIAPRTFPSHRFPFFAITSEEGPSFCGHFHIGLSTHTRSWMWPLMVLILGRSLHRECSCSQHHVVKYAIGSHLSLSVFHHRGLNWAQVQPINKQNQICRFCFVFPFLFFVFLVWGEFSKTNANKWFT